MGIFEWRNRILGINLPPVEETADSLIHEQQPVKEEKKYVVSIFLGMLNTGVVEIFFNWADDHERIADATADMLFKLNNGYYMSNFAHILNNYAETNVAARPFIVKILQMWMSKNEKPLIRPSLALKNNQD